MLQEIKLQNLSPRTGAVKHERRIGRGQGSGYGGTSTRGHKGAQARSGYSRKIGFEGGQMPLQRRLPKFGFKNPFRVEYRIMILVDLDQLESIVSTEITPEVLYDLRLIKRNDKVKLLGRGEITKEIKISVHAVSDSARKALEARGCVLTILS